MRTLKRFKPSHAQLIGGALILSAAVLAYGVPNVFTAGISISAAQMNANFTALETQIANLQSQVSNLVAINQYLTLQTVNGQPTVRFSGVNVQVVNGMSNTATANGTGNLIVGYDEVTTSVANKCSLGTNPSTNAIVIDQTTCAAAGGTWATSHKNGSHYLVLGTQNNYSRWGGLVAGTQNTSNYDFASVGGGYNNIASGPFATVSGGGYNTASNDSASVSGGYYNTASGTSANVSGGRANTASGLGASVGGGQFNVASYTYTSVSGGQSNTASGYATSVSGGSGCNFGTAVNNKWVVGTTAGGCSATLGN